METTYYKSVTTRLTFGELWRLSTNPAEFLVVAAFKLVGKPLNVTAATGWSGRLPRVLWEELPGYARRLLDPIAQECGTLGLNHGFCFTIPSIGTQDLCGLALTGGDGTVFVKAVCGQFWAGTVVNERSQYAFASVLSDGRVLVTSSGRRELNGPPEFQAVYVPHRPVKEVLARHRERLENAAPAQPAPVRSDQQLEELLTTHEGRRLQHHIQRGCYVPISAEEFERFQAYGCPPDATRAMPRSSAPPSGDGDVVLAELADSSGVAEAVGTGVGWVSDPTGRAVADSPGVAEASGAPTVTPAEPTAPAPTQLSAVLAEIQRLQERKSSWGSAVLVLGISLLLFFGLGAARWSWNFVGMLIPILLVHELGHYVAMRLFKYRNVRMFFIPLFGAAVSGQHYNVPGWKKALVSLAGPVPGIGLGLVLGVVALVLRQDLLFQAALLTIALNGFNLVPFLPFDGGWVVHAILFSRHPVLDVAFRGVAIAVLMGWGLLTHDRVLPIIGLFMLFGLPTAYRIARISDELRSRGLPAMSADGQTVPPVTAQAILDQIQRAFPSALNNRTRAQLTLNIFENLNAHPPGVLATLGLAAVHGLSLLAALVFAVVLVLAQHAKLGNL